MNQSYTELLSIAVDAARAAGEIMRDGWGKAHDIRFKGANNLVTEVDRASEQTIVERLRAAAPDWDILAEESGALSARPDASAFRWVIDPVDGTTNYAHHFPYFSVSIGLEERGESILGVVYDPILDRLFTGVRGGGAFLNGAPIRPGPSETIGDALIATGLVYQVRETGRGIPQISALIRRARSVRINGSAALDFCYVACGWLDAYCDSGLSPWDISAARVILAEAGGTFRMYGDSQNFEFLYCIASNGKIHAELEALLIADSI